MGFQLDSIHASAEGNPGLMGIVTAAAGRRDGYQVPVALAEAGLLSSHVTDLYLPDQLQPFLQELAQRSGSEQLRAVCMRHHPQLPSRLVHCSRRLLLTKTAQRLRPALSQRWHDDQDPISWSALRQAQCHESALLLHMGYAHQAFMAEPRERRRRGLVQYHPHIAESAKILREDLARYPALGDALDQLRIDVQDSSNDEELERADLVVCNSKFTARTCVLLGVAEQKIRLIPFGINPPPPPLPRVSVSQSGSCHFLFVGSGIHRKGLHHLLEAWHLAGLKHSRLTLICRYIEPQLRSNFSLGDGVELRQAVTQHQLEQFYNSADVFVLPSMVEGFGYVFLEALARGCFCLGTPNTGLPDIADPQSAKIVPAAQPSMLAVALQNLETQAFVCGFDRDAIAANAMQWSWPRFRNQLYLASEEVLLNTSS